MSGGIAALQLVREAGLEDLVRPGSEHAPGEQGSQRLLPVRAELGPLFPGGGLRRGSVIAVATGGPPPSRPGGPSTGRPTEHSAGHFGGTSAGSLGGTSAGRLAEHSAGRSAEHSAGRLTGHSAGSPAHSLAGLPAGLPAGRPAGLLADRSAGRSAGRLAGRSGGDSVVRPAATSLLLSLLAEASKAGSWCAVVGVPTLGAGAAAELGVALDRLALVPNPGPDWPTVVAALLDGFDIVVASVPGTMAPAIASRLAARARQRGAVLMPYGPWPAVDLTLDAVDPAWHGIESGRGRLRGRQLTVVARGRGAASAPRVTHLWLPQPSGVLPAPGGELCSVESELATVHPLRAREEAG
ncbi:hypothetical protein GCM10009557_51610 [Virgisporangium ochraceum]|uniref:Uncharacterized protein n=1 Tax=Virgisporangium ochraceum TaxID=65505 RepID=A0A8J3ZRM2_9ACTN|nr:hypothetical protein Voc01_035710 [Virgisporangium ochraceum]